MSSSAASPQMMGRRTQFSILELGVGASLAAFVALGATFYSLTQDPDDSSPGAARNAPPPAVASSP